MSSFSTLLCPLKLLLFFAVCSCYPFRQAIYQNNLFNSRQKIETLKQDPKADPTLKDKLRLVEEILAYAEKKGLDRDGNYRHYIEIGEKPVSYLVKAAEPFALEFKTWWFPFVGTVPYLGFFSQRERDREADALLAQGYDVMKAGAAAFSGLGWFEDPIYSSMLNRSHENLAHLLFHELTHRTFWIPGQVKANENIAEFVADLLVETYLTENQQSEQLALFRQRRLEEQTFQKWLTDLTKALEGYYQGLDRQTLDEATARTKAQAAKRKIFAKYLSTEKRPVFKSGWDPFTQTEWNNATILSFGLYGMETQMFAKAYACLHRDLPTFFAKIQELLDSADATVLERVDQEMCR